MSMAQIHCFNSRLVILFYFSYWLNFDIYFLIFFYWKLYLLYIPLLKFQTHQKLNCDICYKIDLIYITWKNIIFSLTYLFLPMYPEFCLRHCFKINLISMTRNNIFFLWYLEEEQSFFAKWRSLLFFHSLCVSHSLLH